MKKTIYIFLIIGVFLCLTGCNIKHKTMSSDASTFKEEYEAINNTTNSSGKKHRQLTIPKNNPFIYSTPEEIVKKIEQQETFYVYFGSSYCPWCRSVIEKMIEVANDEEINKVYYIDIWEGDHNEILRDTYKLNDKNEPILEKSGSDTYQTLLKYLDNVLGDYTLTTEDGTSIPVGEKRIFAPNFIYVENGKAMKAIEGISSKQTDSREKLTKEILEDEEDIFEDFFDQED